MEQQVKSFIDWIAFGGAVAFLAGFVSITVGILTAIWTALRIYEMKTVQDWLKKRKQNGSLEQL